MDNKTLIDNIKDLCKVNGITISQLEKALGFGSGLISRWSKSDPSLSKIIAIADFFHATVDDVIGRTKERQEEFIPLLLEMTAGAEIIWIDSDFEGSILPTKIDNFEIFEGVHEIYYAKFSNGYFYLIAQYDEQDLRLEEMDLQIYIQPDMDSKPIPQSVSFEETNELWLLVRKNTRGLPDAYKANRFIMNFLKSKKSQSSD